MPPHSSGEKLEERPVLLAWLYSFFGYEYNRDLSPHASEERSPLESISNHAQARGAIGGEKVECHQSTEEVTYDS